MDEAKIKKESTNFSFVLFVCLLQCGAAKNLFVLIFLKTFHVPNTKSLCGGWWFQLLMNWQLASKKQL